MWCFYTAIKCLYAYTHLCVCVSARAPCIVFQYVLIFSSFVLVQMQVTSRRASMFSLFSWISINGCWRHKSRTWQMGGRVYQIVDCIQSCPLLHMMQQQDSSLIIFCDFLSKFPSINCRIRLPLYVARYDLDISSHKKFTC